MEKHSAFYKGKKTATCRPAAASNKDHTIMKRAKHTEKNPEIAKDMGVGKYLRSALNDNTE